MLEKSFRFYFPTALKLNCKAEYFISGKGNIFCIMISLHNLKKSRHITLKVKVFKLLSCIFSWFFYTPLVNLKEIRMGIHILVESSAYNMFFLKC